MPSRKSPSCSLTGGRTLLVAVSARTPAGWSSLLEAAGRGVGGHAAGTPAGAAHSIVAVQLADAQKSGSHSNAHVRLSAVPPSVAFTSPGLLASARNHTCVPEGPPARISAKRAIVRAPQERLTRSHPGSVGTSETRSETCTSRKARSVALASMSVEMARAMSVLSLTQSTAGRTGGGSWPASPLYLCAAYSLTMTLSLAQARSDGTEIKV